MFFMQRSPNEQIWVMRSQATLLQNTTSINLKVMMKYPRNKFDPILPNKFSLWHGDEVQKQTIWLNLLLQIFPPFIIFHAGLSFSMYHFLLPPAIGGRWIIKRDQPHQWIIKQGSDVYSASLELDTRTSRLFPVWSQTF